MLSIPVVRRAVHYLHRPFVQRLITLVVSTLLALSLIAHTTPQELTLIVARLLVLVDDEVEAPMEGAGPALLEPQNPVITKAVKGGKRRG